MVTIRKRSQTQSVFAVSQRIRPRGEIHFDHRLSSLTSYTRSHNHDSLNVYLTDDLLFNSRCKAEVSALITHTEAANPGVPRDVHVLHLKPIKL